MAPPQFTLVTHTQDGVATIRVGGDLDITTTPALADSITEQLDLGHHSVVLDLEALQFLGSAGIGAFINASKQLSARGGSFSLANVTGGPRRILDVAGVYTLLAGEEPERPTDGVLAGA